MLSFFRRMIRSRFGAFIALAFIAMIGLAFAAGDIMNNASGGGGTSLFGGGAGGNAAKAGGSTLSASDLQTRVQRVFEQERRQNTGMQMGQFITMGGVDQVYDQLVASLTAVEYAGDQGMSVSKRMVDAQIAGLSAFQDASGRFSESLYRQILAREGITDKALREDISRDLTGKQLIGPAGLGVRMPDDLVLPYASLLLEARAGRIAAIPAAAFAPKTEPTEAQLKAYYAANSEKFTVPEQRRFRYAVIDTQRFVGAAQPTDAEVAAYFKQNASRYAAKESRDIDQIILPTEAGAKAIATAVQGGKSMATAAQDAGLSVASLKDQTRETLAREGSPAVADAAFKAPEGGVAGPVRASLGWAVLKVAAVKRSAAQTVDQVKPAIVETLRAEKEKALLSDFTGKLEDQIANGATFEEAAKDNGLTIETTPFVLSTGMSVQTQGYQPPADVQAILRPGFEMDADDDAQLIPITPEQRYALVDVSETVAAAPPPLEKVRDVIAQQYRLSEGNKRAKAFAEQVRAKVAKGEKLDAALAGAGVPMPPAKDVGGKRAELLQGNQRPPAEIALLFQMVQGSVKTLPVPGDQGWFVVQLVGIQPGDAGGSPELVQRVKAELSNVVGGEYTDQFERAIEKQLGVQRNAAVVTRVKQELRKANGGAQ